MNTQKAVLKGELDQKFKQLEIFRNRHDEIKSNLEKGKKATMSQEKLAQIIELRLKDRANELSKIENNVQSSKGHIFNNAQKLGTLRKIESDLISDIKGSQVMRTYHAFKQIWVGKTCSNCCIFFA